MKRIKNLFIIATAIMLMAPTAYAGEAMEAGAILEEDSYVFTLEEIQNLRVRIAYNFIRTC